MEKIEVSLYIEDPKHKMEKKLLDKKTYARAIKSLVIVRTEVVIFNRRKELIYLARRKIKPRPRLWIVGGRSFAGETPHESMRRCFEKETSLNLLEKRFALIGINRYFWKDREQTPQNIGSDNLAYVFAAELDPWEVSVSSYELNKEKYEPELQAFDMKRLKKEKVHPSIIDLYKRLFP